MAAHTCSFLAWGLLRKIITYINCKVSVTISIDFQLGRMWKHSGNQPLGMPVGDNLD